jgi:ParB-like chromosome segregation protein Spo0J
MINASIVTGDKLIIQLVENIQREDLSASEREKAIYQLVESGLKQTEIAAQLSKSKSYISVHLSAYKMRLAAKKEGVDLTGVETSSLGELLGISEENLIPVLKELVKLGGTRRDANYLARCFKGKVNPPPKEKPTAPAVPSPKNPEPPPPAQGGDIDPLAAETKKGAPPEKPVMPRPEVKRPEPKPEKSEPFEVDHRIIDVNVILTVIYDYMKETEDLQRIEACKDLIALIHKRLDNA